MRFTPASRHMSSWRRAPVTSVPPTALNPPRPPKVIVPSVSADTRRPLRPSCRYSMSSPFVRFPHFLSLVDSDPTYAVRGSGEFAEGVDELGGQFDRRSAA